MHAVVEPLQTFTRSAAAANALLVLSAVALAWVAGALFWLVWQGPSLPVSSSVAMQTAQAPVTPNPLAIGKLFGEQLEPVAGEAEQETTLNVRLLGVLYSSNSDAAKASIVDRNGGEAKWYKVGEEVLSGTVLELVEPDYVVLMRSGREEILRFDKPSANLSDGSAAGAQGNQAAANHRQVLRDMTERLKSSPMLALRQMGMRRTTRGYIVSQNAPSDILKRFSLSPGDRIVSINGQRVGQNLDDDVQLMSQLQDNTSARVEVQRGNQTLTLEQRL